MNKLFALALMGLVLTVIVSGCTGQPASGTAQTDIKNPEQAKQAVQNVSKDVSDVSSILKDIDSSLSGV